MSDISTELRLSLLSLLCENYPLSINISPNIVGLTFHPIVHLQPRFECIVDAIPYLWASDLLQCIHLIIPSSAYWCNVVTFDAMPSMFRTNVVSTSREAHFLHFRFDFLVYHEVLTNPISSGFCRWLFSHEPKILHESFRLTARSHNVAGCNPLASASLVASLICTYPCQLCTRLGPQCCTAPSLILLEHFSSVP